MRKRFWYPKIENIIENNKRVLRIHKETKAERHQILSRNILPVINESKKTKGDVEDKASVLLRGINVGHFFSSGNKRTGYFTANQFICKNKGYLIAKKREKQKDFCVKVREGRVTDKDISDWLRYSNKNKVYGRER